MIHKRIRIFALRVVSRQVLEIGHVICHVNDAIMMKASPNPYPLPSFLLGYARRDLEKQDTASFSPQN